METEGIDSAEEEFAEDPEPAKIGRKGSKVKKEKEENFKVNPRPKLDVERRGNNVFDCITSNIFRIS